MCTLLYESIHSRVAQAISIRTQRSDRANIYANHSSKRGKARREMDIILRVPESGQRVKNPFPCDSSSSLGRFQWFYKRAYFIIRLHMYFGIKLGDFIVYKPMEKFAPREISEGTIYSKSRIIEIRNTARFISQLTQDRSIRRH